MRSPRSASAWPGICSTWRRALARTSFGAPVGIELVVKVSQRELAEAVGTAREVVVRVLRELRQDGVVRTGRDQIVIADPARLIQDHGWNPGS